MTTGTIRIAAVGDLHFRLGRKDNFRRLVEAVNDAKVDALALCGDLTDHGATEEAHHLAEVMGDVRAPVVGVLGNHDFESGNGHEIQAILVEAGLQILDGDKFRLKGGAAGFAGVKGFAGGFDRTALQAFGEESIKRFVMENVQEAMKLEAALARVDAHVKVAITHYAPTSATCVGEPPEISPFLGSSKLGEAMDAQEVTVAFHGHAHAGTLFGRTAQGVPVFNVALPLLRRRDAEHRVFVLDIPLPPGVEGRDHPPLGDNPAVVTVPFPGPQAPQEEVAQQA